MSDWEYLRIDLNDLPRRTEDIDLLNDAGKNGWELVGVTGYNVAFLKRSTAPPAPPAPAARKTTRASTK